MSWRVCVRTEGFLELMGLFGPGRGCGWTVDELGKAGGVGEQQEMRLALPACSFEHGAGEPDDVLQQRRPPPDRRCVS